MFKKITCVVVAVMLIVTSAFFQISSNAQIEIWDGSVADSLSGSGTYEEPYLLEDGADLAFVSRQVAAGTNYEGKFFKLTKDIYLNNNSEDYLSWKTTAPTNEWEPIGKRGYSFRGNLDGDGHTISGVYVDDATVPAADQEKGHGLFGYIYKGSVRNLHIKDSYIAAYRVVGGMVGLTQQATFANCSFEGLVFGYNTNANGGSAGGFIGCANQGNTIEKCYTTGKIDSCARSSGLIGVASGSGVNKIHSCYTSMVVTSLGVKTSPGYQTGGLVGYINANSNVEIKNSFFAGSYPTGTQRGPVVGCNHNTATVSVNNCYYLADAADGTYGVNKTAEEFKNKTVLNLLNAAFETPVFKQGDSYPIFGQPEPEAPPEPKNEVLNSELFTDWNTLAADSFDSGTGKATDPYIIKTAEQLAKISADFLAGNDFSGKFFKIANDIVLNINTDYDNWVNLTEGTLYRWTPIGSASKIFKGTIDGQGHTISGMYVNKNLLYGMVDFPDNEDTYIGFIGNGSGQISNLHFEDSYVCGFKYVGGIAGQYGGKLTNCSFEGYVRSTNNGDNSGNIGGLVGCVNGALNINECYTTGKMNAISRAGGLIGSIISNVNSTITYSYSEMTFDSTIANDGTTPTKSGIGGLLGFAQIGSIAVKTSFYYGNLGVSSGTYGPIVGQKVSTATFINQGNVYYLAGNRDNGMGASLAANRFNRAGFLSYFTDEDGIVRATLGDSDMHPMLHKTYQKVIDKTFVDYTFNNFPSSIEDYDTRIETYQKDGFGKGTDRDTGDFYIATSLKNYGCWTGNKDFTPNESFANGDGYGVGYTARLGGMFASLSITDVDPDLFYTFSLDTKVIKTDPNLTVQIGLFRPNASSGDTAFYDENKNTYDTAIKTKKITADKLTDYQTYTFQISGAEIIEFCEEYSYYPSTLYFGVFSPQFILSEKYRDVYNIAVDNIKIMQSAVPDGYIAASSLPATDILEENPKSTYGEHLYNLIENPSFEEELSGVFASLPSGFTVKTATNTDRIFGDKYLSASAGEEAVKFAIPLNLVKNKFYTFGISARADKATNYKIYLSDSENGSPLSDIENESQKFLISLAGDGSIKRHAIYFRSTMKSNIKQYLIIEVSGGKVDFDEITLTRKTAWETNKNYYKDTADSEISVLDMDSMKEETLSIPNGKSVYDVIK